MLKNSNLSISRSSLRGIKLCSNCGQVQGQRTKICSNLKCELRLKLLASQRPLSPIKLITKNSTTSLYSIRTNERTAARNFVEVTEGKLFGKLQIISQNANCFVETCKCKTDEKCQHVRTCIDEPQKPMPSAEVYEISREVLWNLNIDAVKKQQLWNMYLEDLEDIPSIQKLSPTIFAVKCIKSKIFPAGRLHVVVVSSANSKKSTHSCPCKNLKIILDVDNSVVMEQEEICDHILLVLAGILSKPNGKHIYKSFISALKSFWMPVELDRPVAQQDDSFFDMDINIGGEFDKSDDIFIFDDKFLSDDNLPDFTDIVLDLTSGDLIQTTSQEKQVATTSCNSSDTDTPLPFHTGDPNLVSGCNVNEDIDMRFIDMMIDSNVLTDENVASNCNDITTHLELSDCNIELMDQFELTDRIDLCSDDIQLPDDATGFLDEINGISILTTTTEEDKPSDNYSTITPITFSMATQSNPLPIYNQNNEITSAHNNVEQSLLKSNQNLIPSTIEAPPIELPTIVVKKTPIKASQIVTEIKTRKFPHIPAKRALIVNTTNEQHQTDIAIDQVEDNTEPSLAYSAWLDFVIETINESIAIVAEPQVSHTFQVHEEIFAHFSKTFSCGNKRRMPNSTTIIKSGKYKNLFRYIWYFPTAATVCRIFSTKNNSLETQRAYEKTTDNQYIPYIRIPPSDLNSNPRKKRIYPKLELYIAYIWFDCNNGDHMTGFRIEWIPNVFPKSHFGILKIDFSLGIKDPTMKESS